jgi:hypothetical protein
MSNAPTQIETKKVTAKQHLAGVAGSRAWIQDLTKAHLLDSQQPIKDEPIADEPAVRT